MKNEAGKQFREFMEKRNDPLEKEKEKLRQNRKKRREEILRDRGL